MAERGRPVKLALLLPLVVGAVLAVLVVVFLRPGAENGGEPLEAHSGEEGVVSSIFLPSAGWNPATEALEVSAIVTARVEEGGICRLEAVRDSLTLSVETEAKADASTTTCGTMALAEGIVPGTWQVTVTYRKDSFEVRSEAVGVEVTE